MNDAIDILKRNWKKIACFLASIVLTAVVTTICNFSCACITGCQDVSSFADRLGVFQGQLEVHVQPIKRRTISHAFLFIGHRHYQTTYQVQIANRGCNTPGTCVIQLGSEHGGFVKIVGPALVNPSLQDGTPAVSWTRGLDDKPIRQMAISFETPPNNVRVTFAVAVARTGAFVPDQDLRIDLRCGNIFVKERASEVRWESENSK